MSTQALLLPASVSADKRALRPARATQPSRVRRVADTAADLLLLLALIFCVPAVILAIGIPVALSVQLVWWIVRSLA